MLNLDHFRMLESVKDSKGAQLLKLQNPQDNSHYLLELHKLDEYETGLSLNNLIAARELHQPLAEKLQSKESFYRSLLENAFDSIIVRDATGKIKYVSPNISNFGFDPESFISTQVRPDDHFPEEVKVLQEKFGYLLSTPGSKVNLFKRVKSGDEYRTFEVTARNMLENEDVQGIIINLRDVTEQQKAEQEVVKKERYFRRLIETSFDVTLTRNTAGIINYISPTIKNVLDYQPGELIGTKGELIFPADVLQTLEQGAARILKNPGLVLHEEFKLLHREGTLINVEVISKNLLSEDAINEMVITFRDITERKTAEELLQNYNKTLQEEVKKRTESLEQQKNELERLLADLKNAQAQLVQSEKMASLGQLTAGIAHEINNPINFVSANIEPLKTDFSELQQLLEAYFELHKLENPKEKLADIAVLRQEIDVDFLLEEINALLDGIEEGALRTKEIVLGLKNFSRVGESDLKEANVHDGINSTLMLLKNRLKSGITVKKQYGDLPVIECLPGKLNQVFMNIIKNAIDAVEGKGAITIKTWAADDNVYISVADTGPGMDEETRKKVFEPFFTTKPMGEGTGLGLSISYGIIRQHRGTLEVSSEPGKGAEFLICLPVRGDESALDPKK